jgi:SEC-C motif-containing protein
LQNSHISNPLDPTQKTLENKSIMNCPCGKPAFFSQCCETYILGISHPPTAETLMRSRYSAYATGAIPYIIHTTHPDNRSSLHVSDIQSWLLEVTSWDKLEILSTNKGLESDAEGTVEFIAHFHQKGLPQFIHEKSRFKKINTTWVYCYQDFDVVEV